MSIYTKTGDTGETSLYGGKRIKKSDYRLEVYGTVDELNAHLGWCLDQTGAEICATELTNIQKDLFSLGAELACAEGQNITGFDLLDDERIGELERAIDKLELSLPPLKNFILPQGNTLATSLQVARTIARRAERAVVRLQGTEQVRPLLVKYLNRLSDYLFVLARQANKGGHEIMWSGRNQ